MRVCERLGLPCRRHVAACACPTSSCHVQRRRGRPNTSSVDPMKSSVDPMKSSVDPMKSSVDPMKSCGDAETSRFGSQKCSCGSKERTCTSRMRVCARIGLPWRRQVAASACPTSACHVQRHLGRSNTSSVAVMGSSVVPMTGPGDPITRSVDPIAAPVWVPPFFPDPRRPDRAVFCWPSLVTAGPHPSRQTCGRWHPVRRRNSETITEEGRGRRMGMHIGGGGRRTRGSLTAHGCAC